MSTTKCLRLNVRSPNNKDEHSDVCRLCHVDLRPKETPQIGFKADMAQLRDAILNFGRIDGNMLPMEMAFADTSQSLPRAFEEYDDDDSQQLMYKTVQDAKVHGNCVQRQVALCLLVCSYYV